MKIHKPNSQSSLKEICKVVSIKGTLSILRQFLEESGLLG